MAKGVHREITTTEFVKWLLPRVFAPVLVFGIAPLIAGLLDVLVR